MNIVFFKLGALFYFLGAIAYLSYMVSLKEALSKLAAATVILGFAFHSLAIITRYIEAGHTPVANLYESFSFFAWMIMAVFLIINRRYKVKVLGAFIAPLALVFMVSGLALPQEIVPLPPVLRSFWHPLHVFSAFLGNAIFAVAFCCGIMYLVQESLLKSQSAWAVTKRLPSLKILDDLNYQFILFGFPLLTLGIITGAVWAEYAWGRYWDWDPKETWSLISWLFYAALVHQRLAIGWRGRKAAIMAIVGFLAVLFTFLGVSYLLPGLHSYLG